ncbi:hypothetical protein [Pseudonocardia sp. T1-2H]|uniref:hypothetical protein n=1 Tax=Pseudonocardia sp. T1-2H TaxID=3128899 RepID=UPI003100CCB7
MSSTTNSQHDRYAREIDDPDASLVPVSATEAAARISVEAGRSPQVAEAIVRAYLDDLSAEVGVPVHQWGLDAADVAEARRRFEWVDFEQGETVEAARTRAAREAAAWTRAAATIDRDQAHGRGGRIDQEVRYWTERARTGDQDEDRAQDAKAGAGQEHAEPFGPGAAGQDPLDRARQACTVLPAQTSVAAALDDTVPSAGLHEADGAAAAAGEAVSR